MNQPSLEGWEAQVRQRVRRFAYPPTPDVTGHMAAWLATRPAHARLRRQNLAWGVAVLLAALVGLLAVPPVRAAILEFLQIGAVRIWRVAPTPSPPPVTTPHITPRPSPTSMTSVLDLEGATTLDDAKARVPFPLRWPTHPPDLGPPDHVFVQDLDGVAVILVWMQPNAPDQVRMSLHLLTSDVIAWKMGVRRVSETTVHGQAAVWAEGPYIISMRTGDWEARRLMPGRVLIWQAGTITYRLESDLTLEEAVHMAESVGLTP